MEVHVPGCFRILFLNDRQSEFYFEITRQGMKLCILQAPYPRPTVISTRTVKHQLGLEKKETSRIQATLFENFFKDT